MNRVTGIFDTTEQAECAVEKLKSVGFNDLHMTEVTQRKVIKVLEVDLDRGSKMGFFTGMLLGAAAGLLVALYSAMGPLFLEGLWGVVLTAVLGLVAGGVLGSLLGAAYDLRTKVAHQETLDYTPHLGKQMIALDVADEGEILKAEDLIVTLGGVVLEEKSPTMPKNQAPQISH